MPPKASYNQSELYRSLWGHAQRQRSTSEHRRSDPDDVALDEVTAVQREAFSAVWSLIHDTNCAVNPLEDINVGVFENVKRFCRSSHESTSPELPVGVLFTGSLVPCHEINPLKLLVELMRKTSIRIASIDGSTVHAISDVIQSGLAQLNPHPKAAAAAADMDALPKGFKQDMKSPWVILVERVDAMDRRVFADLLLLLTQNREQFPVTLLVGLSTNTQIDPWVPSFLRSRLRSQSFPLMSPRQCFERVIRSMLLSPRCPAIVLGRLVMDALNNLYLYHHFTVKSFKACLKQALLDHMGSDPLAVMLQHMNPDCMDRGSVKAALETLPSEFREHMSPIRFNAAPMQMRESLEKISGWKVVILWLHAVAELAGTMKRGAGHTLRELYMNALQKEFFKNHEIPKITEWGMRQDDKTEGVRKLSELLLRLRDATNDFSNCNIQLQGMTNRLDGLLKRLQQTLQDKSNPSKKKKKKKSHRGKKQEKTTSSNSNEPHLIETFQSICQDLDEITTSMFTMYCKHPPDDREGSRIFCLSRVSFVEDHIFAAPRFEIPNLLLNNVRVSSPAKDEGTLLQDSAALYNICLQSQGNEMNIFEAFVLFADHYKVPIPEGAQQDILESENSFLPDSEDGDENHRPDVKELRIRFEWAARALEELGLIASVIRGQFQGIQLMLFND